MTESEVLKIFENEVIILDCWIEHCKDIIADCETEEDEFDDDKERAELSLKDYTERKEAFDVAISALKEIHLYKNNKLCLIPEDVYSRQCSELDAYKEIGTVEECREAKRFKEYFDELYGIGLEVANWHQNGNTEPFDNFYDAAIDWSEQNERDM